jgi:hypothetical protein
MMDTQSFVDQYIRSERDDGQAPGRPTEDMLADARRRAIAPRPLISWLMGDPAPGMSALDQRKHIQSASA